MPWIDALPLSDLDAKGKAVVRHGGHQILVLRAADQIYAVPNRCPHEGFPLSEGMLTAGCVLTCNWHNWKFDLASGNTLVGGDRLVRYPARVEAGRVWLDLTPPDPTERREEILRGLDAALEAEDQQRLVRETARLARIGADPLDAVRRAIEWAAERLEFGTTHAIAGAPDWLKLYDRAPRNSAERLAALGEILGHLAEDAHDGAEYPLPAGTLPWDEQRFLAAIERQDETEAIARLRGALADGMTASDLAPVLMTAALTHYADFGHSLIYTEKTVELIGRLGPESGRPLLAMLARSLVFAAREDLIPEFRDYAARFASWGKRQGAPTALDAAALRRLSPKAAMALTAQWGEAHPPEQVFAVLVEAAAWTLLHVDDRVLNSVDAGLSDNVGWLDFTHALTFAEASLAATRQNPSLYPAVLLQLACFIGRNAGYTDPALDASVFTVLDIDGFLVERTESMFDHGRDRFIVSVHLIKTLAAGATLIQTLPAPAPVLAAALNRFLSARMKGRHVLRTARRMLDLVGQE